MLQRLCERNGTQTRQSKRRYFFETVVWFCSALVLGSLCTLLEHWEWIPRVIPFPNAITTGVSLLSLCGVLLSSTIIVPVLFFAGLHPLGYHYTSRILLFIFWFFQGADLWRCLFLIFQNGETNILALVLLSLWTFGVGYLLLRVHTIATVGVRCRNDPCGLPSFHYWSKLLETWGALMILRALFFAIYTLI